MTKVKDGKASGPFLSRLRSLERLPAYSFAEILTHLASDIAPPTKLNEARQELEEIIPVGSRNARLHALARGLIERGYTEQQTNARIQIINAQRCAEPLCATEVDALVLSAAATPSSGFAQIPYAPLDSEAWRGLDPRAQSTVVMAYRRYNGCNDGQISLPYSDFEAAYGNKLYYRLRGEAIAAGFLIRTVTAKFNPKTGERSPDMFALPFKVEPRQLLLSESLSVATTPSLCVATTLLDISSGSCPPSPSSPPRVSRAKARTTAVPKDAANDER